MEELAEKERTIDNLLQQLTKAKVQEAASQKLIKQLQDKIQQLAPTSADSGANFMLASEFRAEFERLMTAALPSLLAPIAEKPLLYAQLAATLLTAAYSSAQTDIDAVVLSVKQLLGANSTDSVRLGLLRMLQENWENLVRFEERVQLQEDFEEAQEINEALLQEEGVEARRLMRKLVGFMLLQEKPWTFVGLGSGLRLSYSKKESVCMDGWVKEGEQALVVLSGLAKDGHPLPNFKTYVLPNEPGPLPLPTTLRPIVATVQQSPLQPHQQVHFQSGQLKPPPTLPHSCHLSPSPSQSRLADLTHFHHDDKENNPRTLNSRPKLRPKRADCSAYERSPPSRLPKREKEEEEARLKRQDLPLNKDPPKKKAKPNTSRKASAGKIVSQQLAAQTHKEKARATERTYKEIIKDKLGEIERGATPKARARKDKEREREREREECRPLKLLGGSQKLREKYMF